jgi:hypothetical protein
MNTVLRFPRPPSPEESYEFHLSDLLATVGIELLDMKESFRCRVCRAVWKRFENDDGPFDRLGCPNRCNAERGRTPLAQRSGASPVVWRALTGARCLTDPRSNQGGQRIRNGPEKRSHKENEIKALGITAVRAEILVQRRGVSKE